MTQEFLYYGQFISDGGLAPVARALAGCSWPVELRHSGYDGTLERALALLGDFSQCLTAGGFTHRVEVYDDAQTIVGYFHHRWPTDHPSRD